METSLSWLEWLEDAHLSLKDPFYGCPQISLIEYSWKCWRVPNLLYIYIFFFQLIGKSGHILTRIYFRVRADKQGEKELKLKVLVTVIRMAFLLIISSFIFPCQMSDVLFCRKWLKTSYKTVTNPSFKDFKVKLAVFKTLTGKWSEVFLHL